MKYEIYQTSNKDMLFMSYERNTNHGYPVTIDQYRKVYEGDTNVFGDYSELEIGPLLEQIYIIFNVQIPTDFTGHSLSVSDVVGIQTGDSWQVYYVDSIGYQKLEEFR